METSTLAAIGDAKLAALDATAAPNGETVAELIARVIPRGSWAASRIESGMVCVSVGGRALEVEYGAPAPADVAAIGSGGWGPLDDLKWIGLDLDVGHGKPESKYESTETAIAAARVIRDYVRGAAEIVLSKSGVGVHVRVMLADGVISGDARKNAGRIAKWLAAQTGVKCDRAVLGRQNLWVWTATPKAESFKLIDPAAGTWTPPGASYSDPMPARATEPAATPTSDRVERVAMARQWIATHEPAIQGNDGSGRTIHAACKLFRFGLNEDDARELLQEYNRTKCTPPWTEKELEHKLADAWKKVEDEGQIGADYRYQKLLASIPDAPANTDEWPAILDIAAVLENPPPRPAELIKDVCFVGAKISLAAPSKGRKTFSQIHMGVCVATGAPWFGHECRKGRVLYVNFELNPWSFQNRLGAILHKLNVTLEKDTFHVLHLRGRKVTIENLEAQLAKQVTPGRYDLIIFDPLYKVLGSRSENDATEMGDLFGRLEAIAARAGSAYLIAHHFAKGQAGLKNVLDRASGSGVVARDGDVILTLTPHEEEDCFTLDCILRDFPQIQSTVLRWKFPTFEIDRTLDPNNLKTAGIKARISSDEVAKAVTDTDPRTREDLIRVVAHHTGRGYNVAKDAVRSAIDGGLFDRRETPQKGIRPKVEYIRKTAPCG